MKELIYAQEQVMARLIRDNKIYFEHQNKLNKDIFVSAEYREMFRAFLSVIAKGNKADLISISREMAGKDSFDSLVKLTSKIDFKNDIGQSIDFIYNDQRLTNLRHLLLRVQGEIELGADADSIITMLQKEIIQAESRNDNGIKTMETQLENLYTHVLNNAKKQGISGLPTGFHKIDSFTGGLQPGNLIVIGGPTSMGKTTMALSISRNCGLAGHAVAFVSLEMTEIELSARFAAMESGMSSKLILTSILDSERVDWLREQNVKLKESNIFINDVPSVNLDYILGVMRKYIIQKGVKLFVVDYLQLIRITAKGMSREERISETARILKNFAKETSTTIILLSQMNREKDGRSSPEPRLSDLRGSGEIEETADIVAFCYRPEIYNIGEFSNEQGGGDTAGKALFIIAKGRSIGTGTIKLNFNADIPSFTNDAQQL